MILLPNKLAGLALIASKDALRYATNAVHLKVKQPTGAPQEWIAEATDGRVAMRVEGSEVASHDEFPATSAFRDAPNGAMSGLVPASEWSEAMVKSAKSTRKLKYKPSLQSVAVKLAANEVALASTDIESFSLATPRLVEGKFPNLDAVMPAKKDLIAKVNVTPARLSLVMEQAAKLTGAESVTLSVFKSSNAKSPSMILVESATPEIKVTGLVCPWSEPVATPSKGKAKDQPSIESDAPPAVDGPSVADGRIAALESLLAAANQLVAEKEAELVALRAALAAREQAPAVAPVDVATGSRRQRMGW